MPRVLFKIRHLGYTKVKHPILPCKPDGNKEFVYTGRAYNGRPPLLESYIKGGWGFSEKRKAEIRELYEKRMMVGGRNSLYPNCFELFNKLSSIQRTE